MIRLKALLIKEFIQMKRDRLTLGMMVAMPIFQLLIFGFAINTDIKHLPTVVFDQSLKQESRELLEAFTASGYFDIDYAAKSYEEVNTRIEKGEAKVGIIIPPDLAENINHGRQASVQVIVDASDSMAASSAISTAQIIGQLKSQELLVKKSQGINGKQIIQPYDIRIRPWYNPDFITAYYMVPGILGVILTMTMVMITSMAIVRERENGTLEQLMVTPLKAHELMLGKIIPYIFVGYAQATLALLVGIVVFDLPMRGSIGLLYALTSIFIVASLTLGVLISNIAKTQMQAMQMSFFVFLPSILLSGFMFPREAMPKLFYYIGNVLPLTYFLQILRGIILKGIGLQFLWIQVLSLLAFIVLTLAISIKRFKKTLA
ncbi:ABC transporter permease [Dendrosporobacter sp. 1207_IL3150]|uniref:ABC transporter permease n=1 Tax=Dendrosporobacter sp. 1207_IL3150 TaxID=3084054 RepID=UPI002FDB4049